MDQGSTRSFRCAVGGDGGVLLGQEERSGAHGPGGSRAPRSGVVDRARQQPVARPSRRVWQGELGLPTPRRAARQGRVRSCARGFERGGGGHGARDGRRPHRSRPPPRPGRERGAPGRAIGRSKGGATTRIVALADALGRRVRFRLLPGPRPDTIAVPERVDGVPFGAPIADRACDANRTLDEVRARSAENGDRAAQAPGRRPSHRPRGPQAAPPDRELLPLARRVQAHRPALGHARPELRGHHPPRSLLHPSSMNLDKP